MAPPISVHPKKINFEGTMEEDSTSVENNGKVYEVRMDVRNFKAEEITITISETLIKIEGKHDTEEESWESSEEVAIPPGVRSSDIACTINENGVLRIQAPVQTKANDVPTKSETSAKETKSSESTKILSKSTTTEEEDVTVETDENMNSDIISKHEDVSKDITQTQDNVQLKLNVSEYRAEEIRITTSCKVVLVTAVKKTRTSSTKDICKRFTVPQGVDPKSITGKVDPQSGTLTISGKINKTTTTVTKTEEGTTGTVDKQATKIRTIHTPKKELIDDINDVQCNKEVCTSETGKIFKINLKVPSTYASDDLKIRIFKNGVVITGRKESETTVRVFHKCVPISGTVSPQEPGPVGTLSREGVLTVIVRTSETTETKLKTQVVEQHVTNTQAKIGEETVTKIQPEVSNEVIEVDPSAEKITTVRQEEGKNFKVEVNVSSYRKEEIHVKIYKNVVTIRGKQERKEESKTLEFYKMFSIPEGQKPEELECTITQGILRITSSTTSKTSKSSKEVVRVQPEISGGESRSLMKMETGSIQTAENFERKVEAFGYKPEEIQVKVENNWVVVRGRQEMCQENNFRSKEFTKKFSLPAGMKPEDVTSSLSPDGILTVFRRR